MLDLWAEVLLAGHDTKPVAQAMTAGYDIELEKQKFEFEKMKYEEEKVERGKRLELEEKQWKEEAEYRKAQLELQEGREKREKEKDASVLARLKQFGDALRSSLVKMGADPIELIPFFDNVDRLFIELEVPSDLQVQLLKPFVNDKARVLIGRLDAKSAADYELVKRYLLDQFRLVPQYFLEQFNSIVCQPQETYRSFVSRLTLMIDYYLFSRKVTKFEELRDLLIFDRVKSVLSEGSLSHVLRAENTFSKAWAPPNDLAQMLDVYYANYDKHEKPKASAIGGSSRQSFAGCPRNIVYIKRSYASKDFTKPVSKIAEAGVVPIVKSKAEITAKRCFKCNSPGHLVSACPQRTGGQSVRANKCAISNVDVSIESSDQLIERAAGDVAFGSEISVGNTAGCNATSLCRADQAESCLVPPSKGEGVGLSITTGDEITDCLKRSACDLPVIELAELKFVNIRVAGLPCVVISALADSGSEINVARSDVLSGVDLTSVGFVQLRGILGAPVTAKLVRLHVCLADEMSSEGDYLPIICAVCDNVNEEFILTSHVVD
jgi:hypothetical protein